MFGSGMVIREPSGPQTLHSGKPEWGKGVEMGAGVTGAGVTGAGVGANESPEQPHSTQAN